MAVDFSHKSASSLRSCYSEEGLSIAQWSFLLSVAPFLSLLLPYKKVRNSQKRCQSTATATDYVTQLQNSCLNT